MRRFLIATTAVAATGFMIAGGSVAQAQLYIAANTDAMQAAASQPGVIDTTTADPRVTEAMIAPYLPMIGSQRHLSLSDVHGNNAPHPLFVDIAEQQAEAMPQQAALPTPDLQSLNRTLYFDFDNASLTADAQAGTDEMVSTMRSWKLKNVEVSGYADRSGSTGYNVDLSRRRAQTVANALEAQGLNPRVMDTQWYGEANSAVPTPDGQRLDANRRVVIQAVE